jgi:DnaK suppressor protein
MPTSLPRKRNKQTASRNNARFRKILILQQDELAARVQEGLGRMLTRREPDDEGVLATENYANDLTAAKLERERHTLVEIKDALARLKAGDYGVCEACNIAISAARLEALPWARRCVNCAESSAAA